MVAVLVILASFAAGGFNSPQGKFLAGLGGFALLALYIALARPKGDVWNPLRVPGLCLAGAVLWLLLGHFAIPIVPLARPPLHRVPDLFAGELIAGLGACAAFAAASGFGRKRYLASRCLQWLIVATAALFLFALLLQASGTAALLADWQLSWQGRFAGPIGNANTTAAISGALATIAVARLLADARARRGLGHDTDRLTQSAKAAWCFAIAALLACLIGTQSRMPLMLTVAAMLLLAGREWGTLRSALLAPSTASRLLLGAILAGFAGLILMLGSGGSRFETLDTEILSRLAIWRHGAELFGQSPLYGYGPGSFFAINQESLQTVSQANAFWRINSAHNLILQLLLVGGLPYLALVLAGSIPLVRRAARIWHASPVDVARLGVVLALGQLVAVAMIDITLDLPAGQLTFAVLAGLVFAQGKPLGDWQTVTGQRARNADRQARAKGT